MSTIRMIVNDFLIHLQNRDLQNLTNLFAENVEWEIPGNTKDIEWLGIRTNRLEVEMLYKLLWKKTEPISAEIHKILYDNTDVLIKGVFTTKMLKTGKIITSIFFIHFVVNDDKIVKYILMEDSYAVSQSLK